MHKLTEIYRVITNGDREELTRSVLVNLALVAFVRDGEDRRRIYFGNHPDADYIDVEESLEYIRSMALADMVVR
mgnify:CR=1 FL=1